jgi:type VI secretion system protein ImpG
MNLREYFVNEIDFLKKEGKTFSEENPSLGQKLKFYDGDSSDPYVKQIIESVAFMSARLHQAIDNQKDSVHSQLMQMLYPMLTKPIPSCSWAKIEPDNRAKGPRGFTIPEKTRFFVENYNFKTLYPVDFWCLKIEKVSITRDSPVSSKPHIRIDISSANSINMYPFQKLRINLTNYSSCFRIYDKIDFDEKVLIYREDSHSESDIKRYGLDFKILPEFDNGNPAYEILFDYCIFPERFCALEFDFKCNSESSFVSVYIPLKTLTEASIDDFALYASPIVNLYEKISDPINWDGTRTKVPLIFNQNRNDILYRIDEVNFIQNGETKVIREFYKNIFDNEITWQLHEDKIGINGSQSSGVVYAKAICMQKDLDKNIQVGSNLFCDTQLPCSVTLSNSFTPIRLKNINWPLIFPFHSQVQKDIKYLKEILKIFSFLTEKETNSDFDSIESLQTERIITHSNGFIINSNRITLTFNEQKYSDHSWHILVHILYKFYSTMSEINTGLEFIAKKSNHIISFVN